MKLVPFKVVGAPSDDCRVQIGETEYAPPEISAMTLQLMKEVADILESGGRDIVGIADHRPVIGMRHRIELLVKTFEGIRVTDGLRVELTPKPGAPKPPVLNAIEVTRES